ncbi:hypothetical protein FRB99_003865 [Tulasnella sp. 403]|nr:hypothetical protein FRB99_003865 [Tulasnella sp. 403]
MQDMPSSIASILPPSRPLQRTYTPSEHDSTPSSPSYTQSTSSHQPSSLTDATSSPDVDIRVDLPSGPSTSSKIGDQYVPAPSWSIARAPRYPGWTPDSVVSPSANSFKQQGFSPTSPGPPKSSSSEKGSDSNSPVVRRFPPAKPLSPHHLARIANALGVQVPSIPSNATKSSSRSASLTVGSHIRRPSSANSHRLRVNSATRFLLYVVPPAHLSPELVGNTGPSNQFRRGSLLPLHATLPSQLAAIAREYSLPSSVGLVVYLLDVKHDTFGQDGIGEEWLGPRISDEAWKLLWAGMLRAEREEFDRTMSLYKHSPSPSTDAKPGLPISNSSPNFVSPVDATQSSPPESVNGLPDAAQPSPPKLANGLRPLLTEQSRATSPSLTHSRTNTLRSESPAGSVRTATTAVSPLLPSLPIVGKIEFDIDAAKATWYDSWSRRSGNQKDTNSPEKDKPARVVPLPFQLNPNAKPPVKGSKKVPPSPLHPISPGLSVEAAQPHLDFSDDEPAEEADVPSVGDGLHGDPLGDVFPSDHETWAEIRQEDAAPGDATHPDRAGFLGRLTIDGDFAGESSPKAQPTDDFQEVLDLLNAKQGISPGTETSPGDVSLSNFPIPPSDTPAVPAPLLGSPIVLEENTTSQEDAPRSPDSVKSPDSLTSGDSGKGRRPAPLILGPSDRIPPILEGLGPTPPSTVRLAYDAPDDFATPPARRNVGGEFDSDGEVLDEYAQEQQVQKELDELEKVGANKSADLTSLLTVLFHPVDKHSVTTRTSTRASVPATNPFKSHVSEAPAIYELKRRPLSVDMSRNAPHNASWPAVPFERSSPVVPTFSQNGVPATRHEQVLNHGYSEETQVRSRLAAEEEQMAAAKKYRPPTPGLNKADEERDSAPSMMISLPPRGSSLPSRNSSRFSADSAASEESNNARSSIMARSLRNLWRKSGAAAQATVRLNASKQRKARGESPPPPLPTPSPNSQQSVTPIGTRRPDSRVPSERPDSGHDPFYFDQQNRYSISHTTSPNVNVPMRASKDVPSPLFTRPPSLTKTRSILKPRKASPSLAQTILAEDPAESNGFAGQGLSPSAFPLTANSRSSFDVEEMPYRPSTDSGDPLTPRLSQFEIVSPPPRPVDLEDEQRSGWGR